MLEGTAALAKFRQSPKPEWKARALVAFQRAMALADPNSATELPASPRSQEWDGLPGGRCGPQQPGGFG